MHEVGVFRGTIRFEGERGFTALDTRHARGEVQRTYRRLCKRKRTNPATLRLERDKPEARMNVLTVGSMGEERGIYFQAISFEGGGLLAELLRVLLGTLVVGGSVEHRDGVRIDRKVLVEGDEGSLLLSPHGRQPVTATVALPKPFDGTAQLTWANGSPQSWIGSLRLHLPGAGAVPLVGAGLTPVLCRGLDIDDLESPCLKRAAQAMPDLGDFDATLLQGSGSHSQALADVRLSWSR